MWLADFFERIDTAKSRRAASAIGERCHPRHLREPLRTALHGDEQGAAPDRGEVRTVHPDLLTSIGTVAVPNPGRHSHSAADFRIL